MLPSTSCTGYTLRLLVAGPFMTAPVAMSNREPWHWHMMIVPVSRPPGERTRLLRACAQVIECVQPAVNTRDRDSDLAIIQIIRNNGIILNCVDRPEPARGLSAEFSHRLLLGVEAVQYGYSGMMSDFLASSRSSPGAPAGTTGRRGMTGSIRS